MSFGDDVRRFIQRVEQRQRAVHNAVCDAAFVSIVEGSPVTGAPGQPVDTGNLKNSWQNIITGPLEREIVTNVVYAPDIEEGTRNGRNMTLRSQVGGFRSVALTRAGWQRLVTQVTAQVVGNGL